MRIKKTWIALLSLLAVLPSAGCMASTVKRIDVKAVLQKDGTAAIEERWLIDVDNSDAKTEWYVTHRSIDGIHLQNLTVEGYMPGHAGLVQFETLSEWDVNASRKEKTGKCGLANNDQEVCWGFGDWGEHEYIVRYQLTNLVKSYDTNDGFNHCFVDMDCTVEQARVVITAADGIMLSEDNTRRWAFGYEGIIEFEGDSIVATPNGPIGNGKRIPARQWRGRGNGLLGLGLVWHRCLALNIFVFLCQSDSYAGAFLDVAVAVCSLVGGVARTTAKME